MPVIPQISPIADPTPFQREQAHHFPGAFGRGEGRALAGLGQSLDRSLDTASQIVLREQDKDNDREAKEMDVRLTSAWREMLYGEQGFYNQQGTNAVAASGAIKQKLEDIRKEISTTASNPIVGELFSLHSTARMQQELETIDRYTGKERKRANLLASEARVNEALQDAMARWNDPKALAQSEALVKAEILDQAEELGWEPEVAQSKIEEALSNIYLGAVEMALSQGSASEAKKMFADVSGKLDAPATAQIMKAIKQQEKADAAEARSLREEQRSIIRFNWAVEDRKRALQDRIDTEYNRELAQDWVSTHSDLGLTYDEMRKEASRITDVDLQEEVERRMHNHFAKEEQARALTTREVGRKINQAIAEGSTYDDALSQLSAIEQEYLFANPDMIEKAQKIERAVAEDKYFANTSDNTTLNTALKLPVNELADLDVNDYAGQLTRSESSILETAVIKANRYMEKADDTATKAINKADETLRKSLKGNKLFFDGSAPTDHYNRIMADLRDWVYDQVDAKKVPTQRDVDQKAAHLATVYEGDTTWIPGFGSFRNTVRDLSPEQRAVARLPYSTIPSHVLTDLELALSDMGVKIKDVPKSWFEEAAAAILMYQAGVADQGDRYTRLIERAREFND